MAEFPFAMLIMTICSTVVLCTISVLAVTYMYKMFLEILLRIKSTKNKLKRL